MCNISILTLNRNDSLLESIDASSLVGASLMYKAHSLVWELIGAQDNPWWWKVKSKELRAAVTVLQESVHKDEGVFDLLCYVSILDFDK